MATLSPEYGFCPDDRETDYSNFVKWYIKREEASLLKRPELREQFLLMLQNQPQVVALGIVLALTSDMFLAEQEIKKSVAADSKVFPTVVVDAMKKYFIEKVPINLEYYY